MVDSKIKLVMYDHNNFYQNHFDTDLLNSKVLIKKIHQIWLHAINLSEDHIFPPTTVDNTRQCLLLLNASFANAIT